MPAKKRKTAKQSTQLVPVVPAVGDAAPDVPTRHGGVIPEAWAKTYFDSHTDNELVSLHAEISLVDAQVVQLTAELKAYTDQTTEDGKPFDSTEALYGLNLIERGLYERDKASREAGIRRLRAAITSAEGVKSVRAELRELISLRRRLAATQSSIVQAHMRFVPLKHFKVFVEKVAEAVQGEVQDDAALSRIERKLKDLLKAEDERAA